MSLHQRVSERIYTMRLDSLEQITVPINTASPDPVFGSAHANDAIAYVFAIECHATIAPDQSEANTRITSASTRKRYQAGEAGIWNKSSFSSGESIYIRATGAVGTDAIEAEKYMDITV